MPAQQALARRLSSSPKVAEEVEAVLRQFRLAAHPEDLQEPLRPLIWEEMEEEEELREEQGPDSGFLG